MCDVVSDTCQKSKDPVLGGVRPRPREASTMRRNPPRQGRSEGRRHTGRTNERLDAAGAELVRELLCCMAPGSPGEKMVPSLSPPRMPPRPASLKLQKSIRLAVVSNTPGNDHIKQGSPRGSLRRLSREKTQFKLADFEDLREISTLSDNSAKPNLNLSGTVRRLDLVLVAYITACPLC